MNRTLKHILIWVFVITGLIALFEFVGRGAGGPPPQGVIYSDILNQTNDSKVKQVTIDGTSMTGTYLDGTAFHTTIPSDDPELYKALDTHGVAITIRDQNSNFWTNTLISISPFVLILALWFFLLRQMRAKSKAANPPQDPTA
jgi:cell division protease FtsH